MKQFGLVLLLSILFCSASLAQTKNLSASQFIQPSKSPVPGLASNSASAKAFDFSATSAKTLFFGLEKSLNINAFPISLSEQGTLVLQEANSVFGAETNAWKLVRGRRTAIALPSSRCFRGTIQEDPGSKVFLVISGDDLYVSFERSSAKQMQLAPSTTKANTLILMDNSRAPAPTFSCDFENMPEAHRKSLVWSTADRKSTNSIQSTTLLETKVAVETDRFLWKRMAKSEQRIISYIFTVFSTVSWIYEREANVCFSLGDMIIHTDEDPDVYTENAKGDIGALLHEFASNWQSNHTNINRSVAVLFTVPGKTGVGGIAFLSGLCDWNGYATCGIHTTSVLPTQSYQWDSYVTAHELGHSFSALHTHSCAWDPPLDTCVAQNGNPPVGDACETDKAKPSTGSIMSYCHLIIGDTPGPRFTFLPRVAEQIRIGAEQSGCLRSPTKALIKLTQPIGGLDQIVRADTGVSIEWTSSKVTSICLEYSLDSGNSFQAIASASNIPATNRFFKWIPPSAMQSRTAMIRIYDPSAPLVSDTSFAVFSFGPGALKFQGWSGGERVGRKTTEMVEWDRAYLNANSVEFSATGTDPWKPVVVDTNSLSLEWNVPDIETSTARLRLVALNGKVVATSGQFSIGTPSLSFNKPNEGDSLCFGQAVNLSWVSDFVRHIDIRYSINNGQSFPLKQFISPETDATSQSFSWTPTKGKESDSLIIRLSNRADPSQVVFSKRLILRDCNQTSTQVVDEAHGLRIARVFPDPASDRIQLELECSRALSTSAQIQILTSDGRVALTQLSQLSLGLQHITVSTVDLSSGSYFLLLKADGAELSVRFVVHH